MTKLPFRHLRSTPSLLVCAVLAATLAGCAFGTSASPTSSVAAGSGIASASEDVGGGTTSGDVPDNAVFVTHTNQAHGFSVQYVEGWQVSPTADGVEIRDKDSSEVIRVVSAPSDVAAYVSGTDLPALGAEPGFRLLKQDTVPVNGQALIHLSYEILSPPDPVTGKQVPSVADRYYVPGPRGLAIVSLATPKGVDNVDAFRQMIESLRWT